MSNTAAQYPPGYLEETRQPQIYGLSIMFITLTTTVVTLRFVSRRIARIRWHLDDTLIVLGWLFFTGFATMAMVDAKYGGVGLHQARVEEMDPEMLARWAKFLIAASALYIVAVALPKFSVISLYASIFSTSNAVRIFGYVMAALVIINYLVCTGVIFTVCIPLKKFWDPTVPGHCNVNINDLLRWARIVNVVTDIIMLSIPIPRVWKLQISTRLKLGLVLTFSLGVFGLIAAIIAIWEISRTDALNDATWSAFIIFLWSEIEVTAYLITASLLAYKPLLKLIGCKIKRIFKSSTNAVDAPNDLVPYQQAGGDQCPYFGASKRRKNRRISSVFQNPRPHQVTDVDSSQEAIVVEQEFALKDNNSNAFDRSDPSLSSVYAKV